MKLVAATICRNERGRYLGLWAAHLMRFVDELVILLDHPDDVDAEQAALVSRLSREEAGRVVIADNNGPTFFQSEGQARGMLLRLTQGMRPTHVLSIDCDEFVSDGRLVRAACEADEGPGAWALRMHEIWKADESNLWVRHDGSWKPHGGPWLWRAPADWNADGWSIPDRALACGREPTAVRQMAGQAIQTGADLLHFGWTCEADRAARYARYEEHDGGNFHARQHLQSIMWPDRRVQLQPYPWPTSLSEWQPRILARTRQGTLQL